MASSAVRARRRASAHQPHAGASTWSFTLADDDLPKVHAHVRARRHGRRLSAARRAPRRVLARRCRRAQGARRPSCAGSSRRRCATSCRAEIIAKKKHGFGLPFGRGCAEHAPLHELAADALEPLRARGIVQAEFIDELLTRACSEHAAYYGDDGLGADDARDVVPDSYEGVILSECCRLVASNAARRPMAPTGRRPPHWRQAGRPAPPHCDAAARLNQRCCSTRSSSCLRFLPIVLAGVLPPSAPARILRPRGSRLRRCSSTAGGAGGTCRCSLRRSHSTFSRAMRSHGAAASLRDRVRPPDRRAAEPRRARLFQVRELLRREPRSPPGTDIPICSIVLPLGISFFTFTQIAYPRRRATRARCASRGFIHYALFVTYFPHLIAGPILHHAR